MPLAIYIITPITEQAWTSYKSTIKTLKRGVCWNLKVNDIVVVFLLPILNILHDVFGVSVVDFEQLMLVGYSSIIAYTSLLIIFNQNYQEKNWFHDFFFDIGNISNVYCIHQYILQCTLPFPIDGAKSLLFTSQHAQRGL